MGCSGPTWESRTDPYSRCRKMPFAADCLPLPGELAWEVSELYTCCTRCYGTSQFVGVCVYTAYGSCTDPYSRCTKMPLAADYSPRPGELSWAVSESYTWCARSYRSSQFVYTAYGSCAASNLRELTDLVSGCTNIPFVSDWTPSPSE